MKIAVTSTGGSMNALMSEKFGRCQYFLIIDSESMKYEPISNLGEQMQNGAGPKAAETIISKNAEVLLTAQVGDKAKKVLEKADVKIIDGFSSNQTVLDVLKTYLSKQGEVK